MTGFNFILTIVGLIGGIITTGALFLLGHLFVETVIFAEEKPDVVVICLSVILWLAISYYLTMEILA